MSRDVPLSDLCYLFIVFQLSVDDFTRYAGSSGNETPFRNVQASITISYGVSQQFSKAKQNDA